jgi:hypothetical protein
MIISTKVGETGKPKDLSATHMYINMLRYFYIEKVD